MVTDVRSWVWIVGPGTWVWTLSFRSWVLFPGYWVVDPGSWIPVHSVVITVCDKKYYKVWQVLQSVTVVTKCDRKLLQSATISTKCDRHYKVWQVLQSVIRSYYRVWHVLESVTIITKWDVTEVLITTITVLEQTSSKPTKCEFFCYFVKTLSRAVGIIIQKLMCVLTRLLCKM